MGHERTGRHRALRATLGVCAAALFLLALALAPNALAGGPFHTRKSSLDIPNLNHACGVAVDTKGDFYASSAGESKVKVFNPAHVLLTEIEDTHEPCGLAVTTTGNLYVSEKATGEVVRFKPGAYPFVGTPTYGSREVIDASTNAKGIAVDRFDNRLYVAEGTKVAIYKADGSFEANVGEGTLTEATGVAAFTYPYSVNNEGNPEKANHYLWVADAKGLEADSLYLFGGEAANALTLDRKLDGSNTPDGSFGFGAAGAYLAADPGNRNAEGKCLLAEGELERKQACTAGHLFLYDETHKALDEFDVTGEYLDQIKNPAFADAEPTAIAIARSGASGDGTIYVTAGSGAGAKALAFGPLLPPSRKALAEPLSHTTNLKNIVAVATDSYGDVYAASDASIHVYQPNGTELKTASKPLIEDGHTPVDLAVDSACNVYVLDENDGVIEDAEVTYYEPSQCPPKAGTTYKRHEELVATPKDDQDWFKGIAVNPGPGSGKDHLFVTAIFRTREYDSAANNSALLNGEFAKCVQKVRQSIAVYGANGNVYIGIQGKFIHEVDKTGKCLSQFEATGASNGKIGANPYVAVDQSNGHVVEYDQTHTAREYDSAGSFIAEFGNFTEGLGNLTFRVAVDSSCAVHEPPLSGKACEEFDSANGNAYVAFADTKSTEHPPFKGVNAFGVLDYGSAPAEPKEFKLTVKVEGSGKVSATGISCPGDCSEVYEAGTKVPLSEEALAGSKFAGWSGACSGKGACEVTMSEAKEVSASFEKEAASKFPLTIKKAGSGTGTVTSSPVGINCGPACSEETAEFPAEVVALTASPASGSEFAGWGLGECESELELGKKCVVTTSSAKTVHATFNLIARSLTINEAGGGTGQVKCRFNGGSAGVCTSPQPNGTTVEVIASADSGSTFAGFSAGTGSAGSCSTSPCSFTIEANSSLTATFNEIPKHPLIVSKLGAGEGTVTSSPAGIDCGSECSAEFSEGSTVTLSQSAVSGSEFRGWSGACSGSGPCEVTMTEAKSVSARFANAKQVLTIEKNANGPGGVGTVSSKPKGIKCAAACSLAKAALYKNTTVELSAKPVGTTSTFSGWVGCDSLSEGKCIVSMSEAKTVEALFGGTSKEILQAKALTANKAGSGEGTVKASGLACEAACTETQVLYQGEITSPKVKAAKVVLLTATAAYGSSFTGWSGCKAEPEGNCEVEMKAAHTVTASFTAKAPKTLTITKNSYETGTGTVSSKPKGIKCATTCTTQAMTVPQGEKVLLTEKPATGMEFEGWEGGGCSGTSPTCEVTVSANTSVKAKFKPITTPPKAIANPQTLTLSKSGDGTGNVKASGLACEAACTAATSLYTGGVELPKPKPAVTVTLEAIPSAGSAFTSWSGCDSEVPGEAGKPSKCVVMTTATEEVTATFDQ
jgi:hypothetical protein